jgi:hypothetical protein
MAKWYTVDEDAGEATDRLVAAWPDAPIVNTETCEYMLEIAREQVWAFAPESEPVDDVEPPVPGLDAVVPARLVYAQLKQAENMWNAGRAASSGEVGGDGYVYTPRPLDKTIRGIIRPIKGTFDVG